MKLTTATLTLLAALAAFPAAAPAQNPPARGEAAQAPAAAPNLRLRLNVAIDDLQKKAAARGATREDYQRLADQMTAAAKEFEPASTSVAPLRERAAARIADIETRARAGAVDAAEFDALRDQVVDMDLEIALGRLKAAAKAGKVSRAEYTAFSEAWTARAAMAKAGNPELDAIAARAKAAVEAVQNRAKDAGPVQDADLAPISDAVAEYRSAAALVTLERKAFDKKASKADYDDVESAVRMSNGDEIAKKVAARLAQLQAAVEGGRITREEFVELKGMLMKRARAASSPK